MRLFPKWLNTILTLICFINRDTQVIYIGKVVEISPENGNSTWLLLGIGHGSVDSERGGHENVGLDAHCPLAH